MSFFLGGSERAAPVLVKHMASDLLRWCGGVVGLRGGSCLRWTTTGGLYRSWPHSSSDEAVVMDCVGDCINVAVAEEEVVADDGELVAVEVDEVR